MSPRFVQANAWFRVAALLLLGLIWSIDAQARSAETAVKKTFDLPVDAADRAIKRFSGQAGLEVFYPSSATKGLRTKLVKGEMTAREALATMLAGSGLRVVEDERTGALAIVSPPEAAHSNDAGASKSDSESSAKKKARKP